MPKSKFYNGSAWVEVDYSASKVGLVDASGLTTATNVEDAITETRTLLNAHVSDARTPLAHASTHAVGGTDPITQSMVKISEVVLGTSQASITFSSIPQTYRALKIGFSGRSDCSTQLYDVALMRFNGDTAANYKYETVTIYAGTLSASQANTQTAINVATISSSTAPTSHKGDSIIDVLDYASTSWFKSLISTGGNPNVSGIAFVSSYGQWVSTAAITSVTLFPQLGANFVAGTKAILYGLL